MESENATWQADWQQKLGDLLKQKGFKTLSDYLKKNPGLPYDEIGSKIAQWVAASQLSRLQMVEASANESLRWAAMDSLARNLNWRCPHGWQADTAGVYAVAAAVANTSTSISVDGNRPELKLNMRRVHQALRNSKPPIGWKPTGADDLVIEQAFACGWSDKA